MIADTAILELPKVSLQAKQLLPEYSGIYYVLDETNVVWYIGKAKNIHKRWQGKTHHRIYQLKAQRRKQFYIYYEPISRTNLDNIEQQRIKKYQPHLNASPVRAKKVRPTETLLRETIAAITDFAFISGVEPSRTELDFQVKSDWLLKKNVLELNVIHICLDINALKKTFQVKSFAEESALIAKAFSTRKAFANKWEKYPSSSPFTYRLCVNGYAVEATYWSWQIEDKLKEILEYSQTTLAQESISVLTPESLTKLQQKSETWSYATFHGLRRLNPYHHDLIKIIFNESVDKQLVRRRLAEVSKDFKEGRRGVGSSITPINIKNLLISRGINPQKYSRRDVILLYGNRIGVYIQSFNFDCNFSCKRKMVVNSPLYQYNSASGVLDNRQVQSAPSCKFDVVYLLASVEKQAWLLVEEYLRGFAKPAAELSNGEGYVSKFYVSARKFVVPAKVNIKLESIGYSAWIPFGASAAFPTYEAAKEEVRRRLKNSSLPELKLTFKRETITK